MFFRKRKDKLILSKGEPSSERTEQKDRVSVSRLAFYFLCLVFLGVLIYTLFFSSFTTLEKVNIYGNSALASEDIKDFLNSLMNERHFKIFAANNYFVFSEKKSSRQLTERFKRIKRVSVRKNFPNSIDVQITERDALLVWCSGGPCYIVDDQGLAFSAVSLEAPEISQNRLIKIVNLGAQPVAFGEKIMNEEFVRFLITLRSEMEQAGLDFNEEWQTPAQAAEDVIVNLKEGWNVYFSSKIDARKSVLTLLTFIDQELKGETQKLEYADLRADNKIFYKLKSSQEEQTETQVESETKENLPKKSKKKKDKD